MDKSNISCQHHANVSIILQALFLSIMQHKKYDDIQFKYYQNAEIDVCIIFTFK